MKISVLLSGLFIAAPSFAGVTNLLVNGDLELPLAAPSSTDDTIGWTLLEPDVDDVGMPVNSATFTSFANHTPGGDRGLWLRSFEGGNGGDEPSTVNATLFQDVAASAGVEYEVSAWFRFEANYTSSMTFLSLQFLDIGMNELSTHSIDINMLNANDNIWRQFSVTAVADAGAAFVRVSAGMVDGQVSAINPQSAFIDDFVLIPAPGGAMLLAAGATGIAARRRRSKP